MKSDVVEDTAIDFEAPETIQKLDVPEDIREAMIASARMIFLFELLGIASDD